MKVLHIAETAKGGVGTIINSLLKIDDIDGYVIIPDLQKEMILSGRQFLFKRKSRDFFSFIRLAKTSYKVIKEIEPDIIHLHSTFAGAIVRVMYLLKLLRKRNSAIIYTPHAFSFLMDVSSFRKKIYVLIELLFSKVTDYIVCTSHYEMESAKENNLNAKKLLVIYNGVTPPLTELKDNRCKDSRRGQAEKVNILFLGRFDYQKGYDVLLSIIERLDSEEFHFDIIGDAVKDGADKITSCNVKYHGWLPQESLGSFFSGADFLIMPSRWESFGLVAVEAQSYGLPVLANRCSSLPEVIEDGNTGVLLDFTDIAHVIHFILSKDKFFWKSMSFSCKKFAEEKFSEIKMNQEYLSLYRSCQEL